MPIALESGSRFGCGVSVAAAACGGSSSAGRGSDNRAEAVHVEEAEDGDGEVQRSLKGPFDTMDALQESLSCRSVPPIGQSAAKVAPSLGGFAGILVPQIYLIWGIISCFYIALDGMSFLGLLKSIAFRLWRSI
jgi:hypothetical protein